MNSGDIRNLFSKPEHDNRVRESWESFLKDGDSSPEALRWLVGDSWKRCVGAKVDPNINQAPNPLGDRDVSVLRHLRRDLIEASKPVMVLVRDFLSETGTVMVLTDQQGVVLDIEGDNSAMGPAEKVHLMPGASWNEVHCGTNAIGTAISLGQPVQIHSEEHFCEGIKRWTCSAAVIRDPVHGQLLGVVDVSGLSKNYSRHSLSLVVATATRIESFLAKREWEFRCRLMERSLAQLTTSDGSGAILVDRHGFPIKLNENAPALLSSLGYHIDLNAESRFEGISSGKRPVDDASALPEWMREEWVEAIFDDGERVGSLVRLPTPVHRLRPSKASFPARLETKTKTGFPGAKGNSP